MLANELVVVRMCADPEPDNSIPCLHSDRSIIKPHASGPEASYFLEMQGRVLWVGFEKVKCLVGLFSDWSGECIVAGPKIWRGVMVQSLVDWPEVWA